MPKRPAGNRELTKEELMCACDIIVTTWSVASENRDWLRFMNPRSASAASYIVKR